MSRCNPIDVFDFPSTADQPFDMNWAEWLEGAILVASSWVQTGDQDLVEFHTESFSGTGSTVAQVWVRGLDAGGGEVFITNQITASDGRKHAATWRFDVCTA